MAKQQHGRRFHPNAIASPYIQHVVIIIQENRSFNSIFGGPSPFPGATTASVGYEHNGTPVTVSQVELEDTGSDIDHHYQDAITAVNSNGSGVYQMNGFDQERLAQGKPEPTAGPFPYKYVDYAETKPYWVMANNWVLGDNFYPTEFGPSFTAHLNLIAGTTEISPGVAAADFPTTWGFTNTDCESQVPPPAHVPTLHSNGSYYPNGPYPCFWQFATMADLLDANGISWRYYAPTVSDLGGRIWSEFDAIERVRCGTAGQISSPCTTTGSDWSNVETPSRSILQDVANNSLANVTWVVPTYADSDHQGNKSAAGPYWVASVVNAIGKSTFWKSTVMIVLWDDWGGWYDEVPPPQFDFRGNGIRTPIIIISPYSMPGGTVSHYQYEPGSILKFIEVAFNLPSLDTLQYGYYYYYNSLGYTDSTAKNSVGEGSLQFAQSPQPFTPVPTPHGYDMNYFMSQPESAPAPDNE